MFTPTSSGKEDNIFITKSYDATSHFETVVDDVKDVYERIMGGLFSLFPPLPSLGQLANDCLVHLLFFHQSRLSSRPSRRSPPTRRTKLIGLAASFSLLFFPLSFLCISRSIPYTARYVSCFISKREQPRPTILGAKRLRLRAFPSSPFALVFSAIPALSVVRYSWASSSLSLISQLMTSND
jgi:hypothetical protein